ncbi:beta-glucosidase BglX [Enterobacteriaceae bacterium LUAb1]
MKWICSLSLLAGLWCQSALAEVPADVHRLTSGTRDMYVNHLLRQMTLAEKIGQLRLISVGPDNPKEAVREMIRQGQIGAIFNTVTRQDIRAMQDQALSLSRLKIPLFFAYDVIHGQRTIFPIPLGLAASWDVEAVSTTGRISAYEAADDGLNMSWAPMVDVSRDPRWGRVSEGFGEDTYLTSVMGQSMVRAMQGKSPADRYSVMAIVKHFAAYGAVEGGKEYNSVDMSLQRLFQDYLPPYQAALDAGAGGVMVALSSLNGVPATADSWLLKDVLRDQWKFQGLTVSDHGAIKELINHGVAKDPQDAVRIAIQSGVSMSMSDEYYSQYLPGLVKRGVVSEASLNAAVRQVLNVKYAMGLFNDPYRHLGTPESDPPDTWAENRLHRAAARDVARKSMVLLKNGGTLPLKKSGTIALIGPLADSQRDIMGSWSASGNAKQAVTLLQGMKNALTGKARLRYAKGANISDRQDIQAFLNLYGPAVTVDERSPQQMLDEAVATAQQADVIVVAAGEAQGMAHEASSRSDIALPASQRNLLTALKSTGKPLVLVLMNGRPLTLVKEDQQADALLESWFSGTEGGNAIADILFGEYNPSGKLPVTFPRAVGQIPLYYNHLSTGRPYHADKPNKYTSRYFDMVNGPLYPFGYGLSYTTFNVSPVRLSAKTMPYNGRIEASVTVTNTGAYDGATVVQLYLQDPVATLSRPVQELKGFKRIMLKRGEAQTVTFPIDIRALQFWNSRMQHVAEPGEFTVLIGLDSVRTQKASFNLG